MLGGLSNLGMGIAGLAGAFDPPPPWTRNLSNEIGQYTGEAPKILSSQQSVLPKYQDLYQQLLNSGLNNQVTQFQQYLPQLTDLFNQQQRSQFGNALGLYQQYAGAIPQAYNTANPQQADLLGQILGNANQQLSYGTQMDPAMQRQVSQSLRAAQSARGLAGGDSAAAQEGLASVLQGQNLYQTRLGNASNAASLYAGIVPQMGLPNYTSGAAAGGLSGLMGMSGGGAAFGQQQYGNPYNSYLSSMFGQNVDLHNQYEMAKAAIAAQAAQQTGKGAGQVVGGLGGFL